MPWGKEWPARVTGAPGGTTRGRPSDEVEWIRRVSLMTCWRLPGKCQSSFAETGNKGVDVLGQIFHGIVVRYTHLLRQCVVKFFL